MKLNLTFYLFCKKICTKSSKKYSRKSTRQVANDGIAFKIAINKNQGLIARRWTAREKSVFIAWSELLTVSLKRLCDFERVWPSLDSRRACSILAILLEGRNFEIKEEIAEICSQAKYNKFLRKKFTKLTRGLLESTLFKNC